MTKHNIKTIQLCPECIKHEINSWLNEKISCLNIDATRKISEELRAIKLAEGECIACKNNKIAEDTAENVIKILDKFKAQDNIKKEFIEMFAC